MKGLTYEAVIKTKGRLLSLTSLTEEEFAILSALADKALIHRMKMQTIQGKERNNRKFSVYKNSSLPTANDRLLFVLLFLKHNITQDLMASIFDMPQPRIHEWLYTMLHTLKDALINSGDAPCRDKDALLKAITEDAIPLFVKMGLKDS
ncbi:transposase family protein [Armatimonas sp.]|uniref:transposase family protein n=1 Tax=Armatimonas sp. TaxID=1872638 RepID=UPI0037519B0A